MDRLDRLRVFSAVAEKSSFAEAARALRFSPAAVTRAVAALEEELGAPLFRRTTRSVKLTEEGAIYLDRCRSALDTLDDGARSLHGMRAEPRGLFVITAPVVFGRMHIAPILARLLSRHPNLEVRLTLTDRVVRLVDEGVDVAVRIADLSDSTLHAVRVGEVSRILVASPDYLADKGTPKNVAQLHDHDLIGFDNFAINGEWRFGGPQRSAIRVEPRFVTNSVETTIDVVLEHLGIARVLSYQVVRPLRERRLVRILAEFEPPPVPVHLLFQANRQRSPSVRTFLEEARRYFRNRQLS